MKLKVGDIITFDMVGGRLHYLGKVIEDHIKNPENYPNPNNESGVVVMTYNITNQVQVRYAIYPTNNNIILTDYDEMQFELIVHDYNRDHRQSFMVN